MTDDIGNWKNEWEKRVESIPPGTGIADIIITLTHRDGTVRKVTGLSMFRDGCEDYAYRLGASYSSHLRKIRRE